MAAAANLATWRSYNLDGAVLMFDRHTGTNIRVQGDFTRALQRQAPRVVMFGITNRCNLTCGFCSRDMAAPSQWTADTAFAVLAGLAKRGTLEVAFGGGEPFAFRGFDELVHRVANETGLAVHATSNGALLTPARAAALRGSLSELRLSIYDDNPWFERAAMLRDLDMRVGFNVLVTPARLLALPALLQQAAALGVRDVAVLSYLGDDAALRLSARDDQTLAAMLADSPITTRLSVCMGDRLDPLPRLTPLHSDGDCAAGRDFIVITSDQKMKQCSFSDTGIAITTADDVLNAWHTHALDLAGPVTRGGCARQGRALVQGGPASQPQPDDGITIWNSFSANNSGDCTLVGQFETVAEAESFAAALLRNFADDELFEADVRELLDSAGVAVRGSLIKPHAISQLGRNVMVHGYDAEDMFPELRELTWRRGGKAIHNGIHLHDQVGVLAIFSVDAAQREQLAQALWMLPDIAVTARGSEVIAWIAIDGQAGQPVALDTVTQQLAALSAQFNAKLTGELATFDHAATPAASVAARLAAITDAMQHARPSSNVWVWAKLADADAATKFAATIGSAATAVDEYLLWPQARSSGLLARMLAAGGTVDWFECETLSFAGYWSPKPVAPQRGTKAPTPTLAFDAQSIADELRARLGASTTITVEPVWHGLQAVVTDADPAQTLLALGGIAHGRDISTWITAQPEKPLRNQLTRLRRDVAALRDE